LWISYYRHKSHDKQIIIEKVENNPTMYGKIVQGAALGGWDFMTQSMASHGEAVSWFNNRWNLGLMKSQLQAMYIFAVHGGVELLTSKTV
jgi:hypothetical protein